MINPEEIGRDPERFAKRVVLRSGEGVCFRPLAAEDAVILGDYFLSLSESTRSLYAPHPFDRATAEELCANITPAEVLRFLGISRRTGREQVIAYFIIFFGVGQGERDRYARLNLRLDPKTDCSLAPSVTDEYQNRGVGSLLLAYLLELLRETGRRRVILSGGTQAVNRRAVHFYEKLGFRKVGEFKVHRDETELNNYDMILDFDSEY